MASRGKILRRLENTKSIMLGNRVTNGLDIPDSHRPAAQHPLLILREAGRLGRAEMEEVMLQARDAGREHLKPFGRNESEDCALGWNAVLKSVKLAPSHQSQTTGLVSDLENDVICADAI